MTDQLPYRRPNLRSSSHWLPAEFIKPNPSKSMLRTSFNDSIRLCEVYSYADMEFDPHANHRSDDEDGRTAYTRQPALQYNPTTPLTSLYTIVTNNDGSFGKIPNGNKSGEMAGLARSLRSRRRVGWCSSWLGWGRGCCRVWMRT